MEPRIQYATTKDGVNIAYWTLGAGRPFVYLTNFGFSAPIQVLEQIPEVRRNLERLASRRMVVLVDNRGQGLSQRDVSDFSLEARLLDIEGVVARLSAPQIDLFGVSPSSIVSTAFAARHQDQVAHLTLWEAAASGRDIRQTPERRALNSLIDLNWKLYVEAVTVLEFGLTELARRVAEARIGVVTKEVFLASGMAFREYDVSPLLSCVKASTLVMHRADASHSASVEASKRLAAAIPHSRLVLSRQVHPLVLGDDAAVQVIERFLDDEEGPQVGGIQLPSGTAVILFADIADSTGLTERMGDVAFRERARDLDDALRAIIRENSGVPIEGKLLGDGALAVFTSARQAIGAALHCGSAGDNAGLPLHVGLHAGDVIREEGNVYGGAVNIASRIAGLSAAGEVLVSETVRSLARTSAGVRFEDRGEQALKGVAEPVRVWAISANRALRQAQAERGE